MSKKARVAVWRDAVRDSDLDRTAKAVAWCLSTYMNANGYAYPSQDTLARGASISDRAVHLATVRLEAAGYVEVDRSRGRSSHRYAATVPATANALRCSEWATANEKLSNPERRTFNPERRSPESVESVESDESGALCAAAALLGVAVRAHPAEDDCATCGKRRLLFDDSYCIPCACRGEARRIVRGVRSALNDAKQELRA